MATKHSLKNLLSREKLTQFAGPTIFLIFFYLYTRLIVESRLIYHCFGNFIDYPTFSTDLRFLKDCLSYPGGAMEYIGGFLSQLYYFPQLGALVITAVAWFMYLATRILVRSMVGERLKFICFIPPVMLLMVHSRYGAQLHAFLALLIVLWFTVAYEELFAHNSIARPVAFLAIFALLFYLVGSTSLIFAILAMIYELFVGRRRITGILFLAVAIGVYIAIKYLYNPEPEIIPLKISLVQLERDPWVKIIVIGTYIFIPAVLFVIGLYNDSAKKILSLDKFKLKAKVKSLTTKIIPRTLQNNKAKWLIETTSAIIILMAGIFISFDATKKKLVQIDYFASQRKWSDVLATARRIRPESCDICCIHDINRALFYTGRLGDEMFRYPQNATALILSRSELNRPSGRIFLKRSKFLTELGHIGIAERDAFEYLELVGNTPKILEQIATIKLVKHQTEAARVFLRVLSKDLIFGKQGRQILRRLERDPELTSDKWIRYIRSIASDKKSVSFTIDADDFFLQLLKKNRKNRLAFEYMMACYLLNGRVDKVVAGFGLLKEFGYKRLPRYYEEAAVIYMGSGLPKMDLHGWQVRPQTLQQAKMVNNIYSLYGGRRNEQKIRTTLGPGFADSYFLYFIFGTQK
jgi:hypothetical protein